MHSASMSLGKDLKGQSTYLRWFLEEHPSERQCLLRMYPSQRRWLVRVLLCTRWVSLLETEINMAAALAEISIRDRPSNLQTIADAYLRRPPTKGVSRWVSWALNANPLLLCK
ncbi:MAG: hypothetical protein RLZZ582_896 [Verrucomicrobiota bacterium]|jgi:hypothetical protein|nr:hypothetical protein [Verrucomicrobiota bacterium]